MPTPRNTQSENIPNIFDGWEALSSPKTARPEAKQLSVRVFGGHRFFCERPGRWISECRRFGIYQQMAGTTSEQWEVYESDTGEPLDGDMIECGLTMAEAVCDAFSLPWKSVYRKHGVGSSAESVASSQ